MNRKVLSLSLLLLAASAFATTHSVGTESELRNLSACASTDTVLLTSDITMTQVFTPMCSGGFAGVFDGGNYAITNLHITADLKNGAQKVAFIAVLDGGVLKNLIFKNPSISVTQSNGNGNVGSGYSSVAIAVGELRAGSVENIHVENGTVSVTGGNKISADAGGIAGTAESGTISESGGEIKVGASGGTVHFGGICGNVTGDVNFTSISYTGDAPIAGSGMDNVTFVTKYGAVTISEKNSIKTAVIDGNYTGSEVVGVAGVTVSSVTFDRVFPIVEGGANSTIILPFSISVDRTHGGTFYEFAQMDKVEGKWQVGIRQVGEGATLVANKPYVFKASQSSLTFDVSAESSVTLNTSEMQPVTIGSWTFAGTYEYLVVGNMFDFGRVYGFSGEAKDGLSVGTFVKGGAGATIKPMRAYLVYNDGGNSAGKTAGIGFGSGAFDLPDEVDVVILDEQGKAIERGILDVRTGVVRSGNWYDLQGRKLNVKPKTQGTYYHNEKRVIVK